MEQREPIEDWNNQIFHTPIYPVVNAAHYLRIPVRTLQAWLTARSHQIKPIIQRPEKDRSELSFTNLIEAHVLRVIRTEHDIPLSKVQIALDYLSDRFGTSHPLVHRKFQTDGADLFIDQIDNLVNVSRSGQLAIREVLKQLLTRVEWNEADIAARFFPSYETTFKPESAKILTIDPAVSFGRPTITGTGIPIHVVTELYDAGDSIEDIAEDYGCSSEQIEAAILFDARFQLKAA